ncbi:MAG: PH domain-containing protein [Candidatus Paceibacterota bacterium]
MQNRLPKNFVFYRILSSMIFLAILAVMLYFSFGQGPTNGTVNGKPTVIDLEGLNRLLVIYGIPVLILLLFVLHDILYYLKYSFSVSDNSISVTSGVFVISTKIVDFKDIQNISSVRGPLLMLFGLSKLNGFTSSPGQLVVSTNSKNGTSTTSYRPDISIILNRNDAEQLREFMAKANDIQKVRVVS